MCVGTEDTAGDCGTGCTKSICGFSEIISAGKKAQKRKTQAGRREGINCLHAQHKTPSWRLTPQVLMTLRNGIMGIQMEKNSTTVIAEIMRLGGVHYVFSC